MDPSDLIPGEELVQTTHYEVVELIGEGGMGKIYKAFDPGMDRYVALKILKPDVPDAAKQRFRREARISANFSHPNLVRVLDIGEMPARDLEWMAMEHLRGRDLGKVVERQRNVAFPLLVDIFRQTLDGLHYVHTRRIVHCDIKPDNIFVTRDSYNRRLVIVKLIDLGICRNLDPPFELQTQVSGDPRYMPPEQHRLNGPVDPRTDLYALGVTWFEVLTQRHPFENLLERPVKDLLRAHREIQPPSPSEFLPDTAPALAHGIDELFHRACAKDPRHRFSDAMEMQQMLLSLLDLYE